MDVSDQLAYATPPEIKKSWVVPSASLAGYANPQVPTECDFTGQCSYQSNLSSINYNAFVFINYGAYVQVNWGAYV